MKHNFKRFLSLVVAMVMVFGMLPMNVFATEGEAAAPITGTITEDTVWNDGDVIGGVTISGNVKITVNGTVTVNGTIRLSPDSISNVTFEGGKLIRAKDFTGQMFYAEGVSSNFQNLTFNNIILDGGAVWTGDVDKTLNRGTTNEGVKATGSVLYMVYANAELNNSILQNHDDSTGEKANAVFLRYYSTIEFNDSVVKDNYSSSGYYSGGVVTVCQGGTVKTNNTEVCGNAGPQGGFFGVSSTGSYGGICEVYNSKFHNNYSDAGAVFDMQCNSKIGYLLIDGCEFYENASEKGLIYEHAYSRPVIIKDSTFRNNECAVWDCHADPVLDLSGKIVIEKDADYTKYLYETALGVGGPLEEGAVIPVSDASYAKLMANSGYLMTEVAIDNYYNSTSKYTIQTSDMEKMVWNNPNNLVLIKTDVNGDGMLDVVPASAATTTTVLLNENFQKSTVTAEQDVSDVVKNVPVAVWFHEGFYFTGWAENANGTAKYSNKNTAAIYEEGTNLYATWKMQPLELKLSRADDSDPYCNTLKITIGNKNTEGKIAYTYQWYQDDVAIEGATDDEYTISETATYKCVVTASAEGFDTISGEKSASASYKVSPKIYVAEVNGKQFETLSEAVAAANAIEGGATVKLLKNVTLGEKLTISGNVTIEGEYTITRDDSYAGTLFEVPAGATLTLDGKLVIDGGNNWTLNKNVYDSNLANGVKGTKRADVLTAEANAPKTTAAMFVVNGTVNANKVTIQNSYSDKDSNGGDSTIFKLTGTASLTMTGATIKHIATGGANAVVYMKENTSWIINEGTLIDDTFAGRNGGVSRIDGNARIVMNGGTISNSRGINVNGTVFMFCNKTTFEMNGGTICGNSGLCGANNGRLAPVYLHDSSSMTMTGGNICHNTGYLFSGIDIATANAKLTISDGNVYGNETISNKYNYDDVAPGGHTTITGGWYSQDVTEWCAEDYFCVLEYNAEIGKELYHVVDKLTVTVTVNDVTYVEGNEVPSYGYTTNVKCPELDITYTVDGDVINATVTEMDGYEFTVVPGKLTVQKALIRVDVSKPKEQKFFVSLQEALDFAAAQTVACNVFLLDNITVTEPIVYTDTKADNVELQSIKTGKNTYTLTSTCDEALFTVNGNCRFSIKNLVINAKGDAFYVNSGSLTLQGAYQGKQELYVTSETGNCVYVRGGSVSIRSNVYLTANGEYPAIQGNGNYVGNVSFGDWIASDPGVPQVSAPNSDMAIYWPGNGNLTIDYGVFTGDTAVYAKSGKITINGGEFYGTGEKKDFVHSSNGASATGDALVIENCKDAAYETPVVSITGGTFTSKNAKSVAVYNCNESTKVEKFISGGFFNVEPDAELPIEGYGAKRYSKSLWTVGPMTGTITVDGVWFAGWDEAETAFVQDCVIKLYGDVFNTGDCKALSGKGNVTLDLNGYTLSTPTKGVNTIWVSNKTVLNVIDSTGGGKIAMGSMSYPLNAYTNGKVIFAEGIQFIGSLQSTNGSGSFFFGETELLGANGIFQTNGKTARIGIQENGDWTVSIGTLTMTADYALADNTLTINKGYSINLNGNNLTAKNISVFGNLIDTADGVGAVTAEKLWFNGHNNGGYLPLKDEAVGGYRLFATELVNKGGREQTATFVKFGFTVKLNKTNAYELLDKAAQNGMLTANASWTAAGETEEKSFEYSENALRNHAIAALAQLEAGKTVTSTMILNIYGQTPLTSGDQVTGYAELSTDTGVVIGSETVTYTKN